MDILDKIQLDIKHIMTNDSAHDIQHIKRVYKNAQKLCKKEKNANIKLVLCAVLLHDIVSYPKTDKRSKLSSIHSAKEAKKILSKYDDDFTTSEIKIICDAISDHSFSQNKIPKTIEGKILQDADRLDAIGSIGIARVFAVAGSENRSFYNDIDPFCKKRIPNDKKWCIDHFFKKLLRLESKMNTKSAKLEAKRRTKILRDYLTNLQREIQ
jgi:uncharacterized protein